MPERRERLLTLFAQAEEPSGPRPRRGIGSTRTDEPDLAAAAKDRRPPADGDVTTALADRRAAWIDKGTSVPVSVVFEVTDEVVVVLDEAATVLTATWQRWENHETVKDCLDAQADLVEAGRAQYVVIDIQSATGAPSARDRDYIHRFVFPRFRKGGLRAIVVVRPDSGHTRIGTRSWTHNGKVWRFAMHEVDSLADAQRVVRTERARVDGPSAACSAGQ